MGYCENPKYSAQIFWFKVNSPLVVEIIVIVVVVVVVIIIIIMFTHLPTRDSES